MCGCFLQQILVLIKVSIYQVVGLYYFVVDVDWVCVIIYVQCGGFVVYQVFGQFGVGF